MPTRITDIQYNVWNNNPNQNRRSLEETKRIALDELRKHGLSRVIKVRITNRLGAPDARAEYIRKGNVVLLHPINRFATASDLRATIRHEISRWKDESRPDRTKEYKGLSDIIDRD